MVFERIKKHRKKLFGPSEEEVEIEDLHTVLI